MAPRAREHDTHRETEREGERERIRGSDFSPSLSPSVRRYLTHRGPLHLPYLPLYPSVYAQCLSLSLSLSFSLSFIFSRLPSIPLSFGPLPDHTPRSAESVCRCVYVRRIISVQDVCQNKGLISFKKNYNLCTRTHTHTVLICFLSSTNPSISGRNKSTIHWGNFNKGGQKNVYVSPNHKCCVHCGSVGPDWNIFYYSAFPLFRPPAFSWLEIPKTSCRSVEHGVAWMTSVYICVSVFVCARVVCVCVCV